MSRPAPLSLTAARGCHRRARHGIAVGLLERRRRRPPFSRAGGCSPLATASRGRRPPSRLWRPVRSSTRSPSPWRSA
eukprot:5117014-Alexandrium_andersonii.AAC.1